MNQLFTIGIGPSSSHTVGPMRAARAFTRDPLLRSSIHRVSRIRVRLLGALGATGIGHGTPDAVVAGLLGWQPHDCDPQRVHGLWQPSDANPFITIGRRRVALSSLDIVLAPQDRSAAHPNAMEVIALDGDDIPLVARCYLSTGGGFIVETGREPVQPSRVHIEYASFDELVGVCRRTGWSIAEVVRRNEIGLGNRPDLDAAAIWSAMSDCIARGKERQTNSLPGGLGLRRRAPDLATALQARETGTAADLIRIQLSALAVNEENAAGNRVVTAPTNGAAGILPAVIDHYTRTAGASPEGVAEMLLTATAIGGIVKTGASISGAEVGCQGEVGTACAMAAGALCAAMGGSPQQVGAAAEMGIEHHLGLTCDPVGGLVQIPCIERNAIAAVTAVQAATLSLYEGPRHHHVSLDTAIRTMAQVGEDMHSKYKETALGGLAVNVPVC
ncbi:L-serine ammonia-lyase [Gordonia desulfuricans]|uniref:L-serine dehydratase n=1 Tax=Gordonia desulfuricans TaxID=89051 RepID=A0A7K3LKA7_9ACTN|nr:L-serine ammonia-lyase [Gordonia desulfuricans]NDK88603.1 L-serine ammonia-lyase [Gordonia desulfuricans]